MKPVPYVELVSAPRARGGRSYSIMIDGKLAEGGFFTFHSARLALTEWQTFVRIHGGN